MEVNVEYVSGEIAEAAATLQSARGKLAISQMVLSAAKENLAEAAGKAQLSGAVDGKNADIRDGQLRQLCANAFSAVQKAEETNIQFQADFDQAAYRFDAVKYQVRLLEATKLP